MGSRSADRKEGISAIDESTFEMVLKLEVGNIRKAFLKLPSLFSSSSKGAFVSFLLSSYYKISSLLLPASPLSSLTAFDLKTPILGTILLCLNLLKWCSYFW
jgi:hypothetical protein